MSETARRRGAKATVVGDPIARFATAASPVFATCAVSLVLGLAASGCASNSVIFATSTMTGIEAASGQNGQQTAHIGYKRMEAVIMPTRDEDGLLRSKPYSVSAAYRFESGSVLLGGFGTTKLQQTFATGKAATVRGGEGVREAFAVEGSFELTAAGVCLGEWMKGNAANRDSVRQWLKEKGLAEDTTMFARSDDFTDEQRRQAISDLTIPCEEE